MSSHCRPGAACLFASLIAVTGCAMREPETYRLRSNLLIPPGVARPDNHPRTIAAGVTLHQSGCAGGVAGIEVMRRGNRAQVKVAPDALARQPAGWLADWADGLESRGCVADGEGLKLAERVAESVPLAPSAAFRLLHADIRQSPFLDLGVENRLEVQSPILREGAPADAPPIEAKITGLNVEVHASPDLLGYEIAWYTVRAKPQGYGFQIAPLYAESHIRGMVERQPAPRINYFRFRADAAFYRMFYRGDQTIVVLAAATRSELDRETGALIQNPGACAGFPMDTCVAIPRTVGVNADIIVTANRAELALPPGATVGVAIRTAGEAHPENVLSRLRVHRLYLGKMTAVEFTPGDMNILGLTLLGGEEVSW